MKRRQKETKVTIGIGVMALPGGWTSDALAFLEKIPAYSIGRVYLWHITHGGFGIWRGTYGLRQPEYLEIRRNLMRHGFPAIGMKIFKLGYEPTAKAKSLLYELLRNWRTATRSEKAALQKGLALCQSSSGH